MPQNPTIVLDPDTKETLTSLKAKPSQTYNDVVQSLITSAAAPKTALAVTKQQQATAGAGAGKNVTYSYAAILGWISDTKKKIPKITPEMRREAFAQDALTRGVIAPFLKNIILNDYDLVTADNKKFEGMIKEQKQYLEDIKLMQVFREDFEDYAITCGHTYRRKDEIEDGIVSKLQRIEPSSTKTYEDPWDSTIRAYHQRINILTKWNSTGTTTKMIDSWFVPGGKKWIESEGIEEDGARDAWEQIKARYGISEISNLRVDAAEKIISIHKVREGDPAPIDPVILNIWLKKLIMVNGPNFIFRVLIPFIHIQNGIVTEATLPDGTKTIISSVPAQASSLDPEKNAQEAANYAAYTTACQDDADNLLRYMMEGGIFSSGPDKKLNIIESGRSISPAFIQTMISLLNEDIGQAFGFPVSLIMARGAELATTGTILNIFNTAYAGSRQDYERVANDLLRERFSGQSWNYTITGKDGTTETGTFTFEETETQFKLKTGDTKDALKEAQTAMLSMQTLVQAKTLGASKADIQALGEEAGLGILDLDKFDIPPVPVWGQPAQPQPEQPQEKPPIPAIEGIQSSAPAAPQEDQLTKDLQATYMEAQKAIEEALGKDTILESSKQQQTELDLQLTKEKLELVRAMKGKV